MTVTPLNFALRQKRFSGVFPKWTSGSSQFSIRRASEAVKQVLNRFYCVHFLNLIGRATAFLALGGKNA